MQGHYRFQNPNSRKNNSRKWVVGKLRVGGKQKEKQKLDHPKYNRK